MNRPMPLQPMGAVSPKQYPEGQVVKIKSNPKSMKVRIKIGSDDQGLFVDFQNYSNRIKTQTRTPRLTDASTRSLLSKLRNCGIYIGRRSFPFPSLAYLQPIEHAEECFGTLFGMFARNLGSKFDVQ